MALSYVDTTSSGPMYRIAHAQESLRRGVDKSRLGLVEDVTAALTQGAGPDCQNVLQHAAFETQPEEFAAQPKIRH